MLEMIYQKMYIAVLVILAVMLFVCLIRAVRGPRVADRIMAVNMMGTMVMVMIVVLSLLCYGELPGGGGYFQGLHRGLYGKLSKEP